MFTLYFGFRCLFVVALEEPFACMCLPTDAQPLRSYGVTQESRGRPTGTMIGNAADSGWHG